VEHKGISDLAGAPPNQDGWQLHCYSHGYVAGSVFSTSLGLLTPPEPEERVYPQASELYVSGSSLFLIMCKSHYRRQELSCDHLPIDRSSVQACHLENGSAPLCTTVWHSQGHE